jgi:acid phosphatase family membrane protein YuiD
MYQILILPLSAGLISQLIKFFIKSNRLSVKFDSLFAYSGMPSGHTAITVALATIIGLKLGLSSPLFAISLVLAILVIRDAVGLRRYLGEHGKILNILVKDLKDDRVLDEHYPHLLERIGHSPAQVAAGGAIGLLVSLIGNYFFS